MSRANRTGLVSRMIRTMEASRQRRSLRPRTPLLHQTLIQAVVSSLSQQIPRQLKSLARRTFRWRTSQNSQKRKQAAKKLKKGRSQRLSSTQKKTSTDLCASLHRIRRFSTLGVGTLSCQRRCLTRTVTDRSPTSIFHQSASRQ